MFLERGTDKGLPPKGARACFFLKKLESTKTVDIISMKTSRGQKSARPAGVFLTAYSPARGLLRITNPLEESTTINTIYMYLEKKNTLEDSTTAHPQEYLQQAPQQDYRELQILSSDKKRSAPEHVISRNILENIVCVLESICSPLKFSTVWFKQTLEVTANTLELSKATSTEYR